MIFGQRDLFSPTNLRRSTIFLSGPYGNKKRGGRKKIYESCSFDQTVHPPRFLCPLSQKYYICQSNTIVIGKIVHFFSGCKSKVCFQTCDKSVNCLESMRIDRPVYLDKMIRSRGNGFIKIITGLRRCGKSYLLKFIFRDYLLEEGVSADHVIVIDLEDKRQAAFKDPDYLLDHVDNVMKDENTYL